MAIDPRKLINTGEQSNDGTGDSIRDAFVKVNTVFSDIYRDGVPTTIVGGDGSGYLNSLSLAISTGTNIWNVQLPAIRNSLTNVYSQLTTLRSSATNFHNSLTFVQGEITDLKTTSTLLWNLTTSTQSKLNQVISQSTGTLT